MKERLRKRSRKRKRKRKMKELKMRCGCWEVCSMQSTAKAVWAYSMGKIWVKVNNLTCLNCLLPLNCVDSSRQFQYSNSLTLSLSISHTHTPTFSLSHTRTPSLSFRSCCHCLDDSCSSTLFTWILPSGYLCQSVKNCLLLLILPTYITISEWD